MRLFSPGASQDIDEGGTAERPLRGITTVGIDLALMIDSRP